jgi:hypothetical protein
MTQNTKHSNNNGISSETDTELCKFLLSSYKGFGLKTFKSSFSPTLKFPESTPKVTNRLAYLKDLQSNKPAVFAAVTTEYGIGRENEESSSHEESDSDEESDTDEEDEPQEKTPSLTSPPVNNKVFLTPPKQTVLKTTTTMTRNDIGKVLVTKVADDIYWVIAWVEQKLDKRILEVILEPRQAKLRKKKPKIREPQKDAMDILEDIGYSLAREKNHVVVAAFAKTLRQVKSRQEAEREDDWAEEVLCDFPEDMQVDFVDENGRNNSTVAYDIDEDGRQRIAFFVKTVASHDKPVAPDFKSLVLARSDRRHSRSRKSSPRRRRSNSRDSRRSYASYDSRDRSYYGTPARDDDDKSYMDITIPGEADNSKIDDLVEEFKKRTENMEKSQQQENAAIKANIDNLGSMVGQIAAAVQKLAVQPSPTEVPLPDGHASYGGVF